MKLLIAYFYEHRLVGHTVEILKLDSVLWIRHFRPWHLTDTAHSLTSAQQRLPSVVLPSSHLLVPNMPAPTPIYSIQSTKARIHGWELVDHVSWASLSVWLIMITRTDL